MSLGQKSQRSIRMIQLHVSQKKNTFEGKKCNKVQNETENNKF